MPDLRSMLESAADAVAPRPLPPFADVERRFRRRRARRTGASLGVVVLLAGGVVGLVSLADGPKRAAPATPQPCVPHTEVNSRDTFLAIPRSGMTHLDVEVGSLLTVGWSSCDETGELKLSGSDPKQGAYLGSPGTGISPDTTKVASVRYEAFRSGTVTVTGSGSEGSTGALEIAIVPAVEPVGASEPSPFPGDSVHPGVPSFCLTPDAVDGTGRITEEVTLDSATIAPAPGVTSRLTAAEVLHRFMTDPLTRAVVGHARAAFGRVTDDYSTPFPKARPLWVVVVCDAPLYPSAGGGLVVPPTPAPGTTPSPGGRYLGFVLVGYDEEGKSVLGESISGYADADLRASVYVEVPFTRNQVDTDRQVGLTYRSDDSCSTFDHLDVSEYPVGSVYVRVWLRLTGDAKSCTGTSDAHDVTVGLRTPLAERPLVRGVSPR